MSPRGRWRLLPLLAVSLLGAFADCDVMSPFPSTRATFSLRLTGAIDTLVANGLGRWTDFPTATDGADTHQLMLWADPAPGATRAPRVVIVLTRQAPAPPLAAGVELGRGEGLHLAGALLMDCPTDDAGGACATSLATRDDGPLPTFLLTRVQQDTISGRGHFVVVGRLPGTPPTAGSPPDTVAVAVEFTVARNPD